MQATTAITQFEANVEAGIAAAVVIRPEQPRVIAIDDWMVWARDAQGRIVETCAEMWPEWLDEARDPSDMETDEYRAAVLRILRTKRPQWIDTIARHTDASDPDAIGMILADLATMEADQAAFIAAEAAKLVMVSTDTAMHVYGPSDLDTANAAVAAVAKRDATLPTMTEAEFLAIPADYRSVWTSERTDWANWDQVRDRYMGKRTYIRENGLEVEGISFRIVDAAPVELILNQSQAEAVYDAMCVLNKLGKTTGSVIIPKGADQDDEPRVTWSFAGVAVRLSRTFRVEDYADQAAFAAAYDLE